jgi:hypothetical protein
MIRTRRLVTLLIGAWLGASLPVDVILVRHAAVRPALLADWGMAQVVFSLILFLVLLFGTRAGTTSLSLSLAILLLSSALAIFVIPRMGSRALHMPAVYAAIEGVRLLIAVLLAGRYLFVTERRRRPSGDEVYSIDHADDSRIDW